MVVFQDAMPKKAHYRKFAVRSASTGRTTSRRWREVISRRFARLSDARRSEFDERFAATPNLVVIDGGKGQLSAALAAMQAYDLPRVAVIALAKRVEEVFVPGRPDPIVLDPHNPGLQLLQRIRDEAHRFALGFHRQRRDARGVRVDLRRARRASARRGGARCCSTSARRSGVLAASQEELEGVPGRPGQDGARGSTRSCTRRVAPELREPVPTTYAALQHS